MNDRTRLLELHKRPPQKCREPIALLFMNSIEREGYRSATEFYRDYISAFDKKENLPNGFTPSGIGSSTYRRTLSVTSKNWPSLSSYIEFAHALGCYLNLMEILEKHQQKTEVERVAIESYAKLGTGDRHLSEKSSSKLLEKVDPSSLTEEDDNEQINFNEHIYKVDGEVWKIPERELFFLVFEQLLDEPKSVLYQTFSGNRPIGPWQDSAKGIKRAHIVRHFELAHPIDINFCQSFVSDCKKHKSRLEALITWHDAAPRTAVFSKNLTLIRNVDAVDLVITSLPMVRNPDDISSYFSNRVEEKEVVGWQISSNHSGDEVKRWFDKIRNHCSSVDPQRRLNEAKEYFWSKSVSRYCQAVAGAFAKELASSEQEYAENIECISLVGSATKPHKKRPFGNGDSRIPNDIDVVVAVRSVSKDFLEFAQRIAKSVCKRYTTLNELELRPIFDACPIHVEQRPSRTHFNTVYLHILIETEETIQDWSPILSYSRGKMKVDLLGDLAAFGLRNSILMPEALNAKYGVRDCREVLLEQRGVVSRFWNGKGTELENEDRYLPIKGFKAQFARYSAYWCAVNVLSVDGIDKFPEIPVLCLNVLRRLGAVVSTDEFDPFDLDFSIDGATNNFDVDLALDFLTELEAAMREAVRNSSVDGAEL